MALSAEVREFVVPDLVYYDLCAHVSLLVMSVSSVWTGACDVSVGSCVVLHCWTYAR